MSDQPQQSTKPPLMRWYFARPGKGSQRQRNSKLDDHFAGSGSDRAGDLGREGTQNAGDAVAPGGPPVRVRIGFGELSSARAAVYGAGLAEHVPEIAKQKGMANVSAITSDGPCAYLSFEDFNTTGLTGDPHVERRYDGDPPNAFHTFFRAEGQTDKINDKKQGSHGIGKVAFMSASNGRAVLGLTRRYDDGRELLFGTAVLHTHRHAGDDFDGDAWYGRLNDGDGVQPAEDPTTLARFRSDFNLARKLGEPGFSVVVPWLNREEVEPENVIDTILSGHVLPILRGDLVVEIADGPGKPDTVIDAAHFLSVLETRKESLKNQVRPVAELAAWALANTPTEAATLALHSDGAPRWANSNLMSAQQRDEFRSAFDADKPVAIRVPVRVKPKTGAEIVSYFDVFFRRETTSPPVAGQTVQFVRGGLLITGMGKRLAGVRGLVVVEDSGLAGMLRAAENPSHTRWNAKAIKETFQLHSSTVSFVVEAARELVKLLAGDPAEKDGSVWASELSVTAGNLKGIGTTAGGGKKKGSGKGGDDETGDKDLEPIKPPTQKRPYSVKAISGGFVVRPSGKPFAQAPSEEQPITLELGLAYHVRGKNPLNQWSPNDFDLADEMKIQLNPLRGCAVKSREGKRLVLEINNTDFEFKATGFDVRRELFCKPQLEKITDSVAAAAETDSDDSELAAPAQEGGAA